MTNRRSKYQTFASPSLVTFALFPWELIILIVLLLIVETKLLAVLWTVTMYLIVSAIIVLIYHNAFTIVKIDESGISNNYATFKWEEIDCIETLSVDLFKYSLIPTIQVDILCFSKSNKNQSFLGTNRDCIFVEATKQNIAIIESHMGPLWENIGDG